MHPLAEFNVALPCAARINENMELWEIKGTLTPYEPECRRVFSIIECTGAFSVSGESVFGF